MLVCYVCLCAHMCHIKCKGDTVTLKSIQINLAIVFLDHLHPPLPKNCGHAHALIYVLILTLAYLLN